MGDNLSKENIARQICDALKMMYLKGLITPLTGNISVRLGDTILMTPSSFIPVIRLKYELKPEDLVEVDLDGNVIKGGRSTTELPMHLAIYKECDKCNAIVHIHGVYFPLLKFSETENLFLDTELKYILKPRICFVRELIPRTTDLASAALEKVREGCEILYLERHGVVTVSDNLGMALELAELSEVIAARTIYYNILSKQQ
ncbi:MAG: class II aldolase/adducin family protein [Nitrososphaeria archaeon]